MSLGYVRIHETYDYYTYTLHRASSNFENDHHRTQFTSKCKLSNLIFRSVIIVLALIDAMTRRTSFSILKCVWKKYEMLLLFQKPREINLKVTNDAGHGIII